MSRWVPIEFGADTNLVDAAVAKALEREGWQRDLLPVDSQGRVTELGMSASLHPDTRLVSVMMANNETGVVFPIRKIARMVKESGGVMHTDAVQAVLLTVGAAVVVSGYVGFSAASGSGTSIKARLPPDALSEKSTVTEDPSGTVADWLCAT